MKFLRGIESAIIRDLRTWLRALNRKTRRVLAVVLSATLAFGLLSIAPPVKAVIKGCSSAATTSSGGFTIVRFTSVEDCEWQVPTGVTSIDFLVVGGGGGGGSRHAGGGGAGGLRTSVGTSGGGATAESRLTVTPGSVLAVTVGAGGTGGAGGAGTNGLDSKLGTITAKGGGTQGTAGGSGGGANCAPGCVTAGAGTSGQGYVGGAGVQGSAPNNWAGGGGGGAGGAGNPAVSYNSSTATNAYSGVGGAGVLNSITGTAVCYAAGGAGGYHYSNFNKYKSGVSGGGCGSGAIGGSAVFPTSRDVSVAATPGTTNTGSGGAGGGFGDWQTGGGTSSAAEMNWNGGAGGSGVVIVRYSTSNLTSCGTPTTSTTGPYTVLTFSTVGTCNWTVPQGVTSVDTLIVGGGGGAGFSNLGGGGGGGGVLYKTGLTVTPNTTLPIAVGDGGTAGLVTSSDWRDGGSGSSSRFDSFEAIGGGGGGGGSAAFAGKSGGSGGGGAGGNSSAGGPSTKNLYSTWFSYGNLGGQGISGVRGGGGAGAGGAGSAGNSTGNGGAGIQISITGTPLLYGGGGAGWPNATGGSGGGGNALSGTATAASAGTPGTNGLGGGGGGGNAGGSGVVIVRYIPPAPALPVTSGLFARYVGAQYDDTEKIWVDASGNGRNVTSSSVNGTVNRVSVAGTNGVSGSFTAIGGETTAGIRFPTGVLPSTYTLFHIARYSGATQNRIFNGWNGTENWLSGFWRNASGVAFHSSWMTPETPTVHGSNWVLSSDQNSLYRSNGKQRGTGGGTSAALSINWGSQFPELSQWQVAEVIVYDRQLTAAEIRQVEISLAARYGIQGLTSSNAAEGVLQATNISAAKIFDPITSMLTNMSSSTLRLSWTTPSDVTGVSDYTVDYSTSASGPWTNFPHAVINPAASTSASLDVTGLNPGTNYFFRITPVDSGATRPSTVSAASNAPGYTYTETDLIKVDGINNVPLSGGGNGGGQYIDMCPAGQVAYGVTGSNVDVNGLARFGLRCKAVNIDGKTFGATTSTTTLRGTATGGTSAFADCSAQALVGLQIDVSTIPYAAGATPLCGDIPTGNTGSLSLSGSRIGTNYGTDVNSYCPVGEVVIGIQGKEGSITDRFGVLCGYINVNSTFASTITVSPASLTANGLSTSTITIQMKTPNGINRNSTASSLSLASTAGSITTPVYGSNGQYTATYTSPTTSGTATISGTLETVAMTNTAAISLAPGPATQFAVTDSGGSTALTGTKTAGTPFNVRITARDVNGNIATGFTGTVTLTSPAFAGSVTGTISTNGFVDAIAITPTINGTNVAISAAATGITAATSSGTFGVQQPLQLTTAANGAASGVALAVQPVISVLNSTGSVDTTSSASVSVSVSAGASLSGAGPITAVNGVATFTNLAITGTVGSTYTLTFTSSGTAGITQSLTVRVLPTSATISSSASSNGAFYNGIWYADSSSASTINTTALQTALSSNSVIVQTTAGDITVSNAITSSAANKKVSLIAIGNIVQNASITLSGTGTGILHKATGNITTGSAVTNQTNNADIILWSDSDQATSAGGHIAIGDNYVFNTQNGGSSQTSGGGKIVLAGGADNGANSGTSGDGIPDNFAQNRSTDFGISLGATSANTTSKVYSGGGDIILLGENAGGTNPGMRTEVQSDLNSGNGLIRVIARATGGHGMEIAWDNYGTLRNSWKSSGGTSSQSAIVIDSRTTSTSTGHFGLQASWPQMALHSFLVQATGAGGISVTGASGSAAAALALNATSLLSASGDINVDTGTKPFLVNKVNNSATYTGAGFETGACSTTCTGLITSSTANVNITTSNISTFSADLGTKIKTSGKVTIKPSGSNSFSDFRSDGLLVDSSATELTFGSSSNNSALPLTPSYSINGPITAEAGSITVTGGLTSSANSNIQLTTDQLAVNGGITSTSGSVTITPKTTSKNIDFGGTDSASLLALTDAELDRITASKLRIGSTSGTVNFSAAMSPANVSTVKVTTTGNVTTSATGAMTVAHLAVTGANVTMSGANAVSNLAITSSSNTVSYAQSGTNFTPATVDGVTGVYGVATKLVMNTQMPTAARSGIALTTQPVVGMQDAYNNTMLSSNSTASGRTVTATLASGSGTLSNATATTSSTGVATFSGFAVTGLTGTRTFAFNGTNSAGTTLTTANPSAGTVLSSGEPATMTAESVTSQSVTAGSTTTAPSVKIVDSAGNPVSGAIVTFAVTAGGGSVLPSTVTTNGAGIATLTSWTTGTSAGTNTVTATLAGVTGSPMTFTATTSAGAATKLGVGTQPVGKASGTTLQTQPVIRIQDANGNTVLTDQSTVVTVELGSGSGGTLGGTMTATAVNGVATFTNLTLAGIVGTNYVLKFTSSPSLTLVNSENVNVSIGALSASTSTVTPGTATMSADGVSTQTFTVTLKDAQGNQFTTTNDIVSFSTNNSLGVFANATNKSPGVYEGVYTAGTSPGTDTVTVTASDVDLSTKPVVTLNPGIPSTVTSTVTAASTSLTANGESTSLVTIRLKDSSGNNIPRGGATVSIRVSSGPGSIDSLTDNLNGTYTTTFRSSTTSGTTTLIATVGGVDIVDTEIITLNPGTATKLGVTVQPSNSNASGATFATQPRVAIQDANGNTVTSVAATTITVGLVGTDGTLSGTLTANTSSGVATFSGLTLAGLTSNSYRLSFSAGSFTGITSDLISITPGAASTATSTVTASSTSIVANGSTTSIITVRLKDAQGNPLVATGGTVVVSKSSGGGTVGETTNNNNGTYSATLTSATSVGTAVIQATIGGNIITDTESIALVAGPAAKIAITRAPVTGANASNFATQPQITLQDANSNTVITNSSSNVTVTLQSGANGTLSGTKQITFVNGVAEFTNLELTGRTSTNYVLRFTADTFTADSGNLTLTPGTASTTTSTVIATDSTLTATGSTSTTITIRLKDAQTNALTASGGTVTVSVASGGGSLSTVTNNNNGTYTATYTSGTTAGTAVINASLGGSAISDTESITLVHGVANKIRITQQPAGTASGTALGTQPIVEITDINNNRVVADSSTAVTVAISAGSGGTLSGTRTVTAATGLVEFTNLNLAGLVGQNYKLTFSSGSLISVEAASISVTPGAAVVGTSTITASNTSIVANGSTTSTITVQLKDAQGNSLTTGGDSVGVRVSSGTGSFGSVTNVGNGTYTALFTSSTTAGTSTITASLGGSDITATQNITLTPGTATKLSVAVQPSSSNASGAVIGTQPRVAIQDANGNIVAAVSATTITVDVIGNGGSVGGTQTATTSSGVASFSGLTLAGLISENYVLSFTANGLTGIESNTISITPGAASIATSAVTTSSTSIVADGSTTSLITVQLKDAQGNSLTAGGGTVVVSKQSGGGTVSTTTNNNDGTYSATFTSPTTAGTTVIRATVGGNTISDTESITLRHGVATKLVITQAPVAGASSSLLTTQPEVTLQDFNGNTVTSNNVDSVTVAISSGANGNLTGTKTLVLSNGVAAYADLNLAGKTGTNYVLRFESGLFSTTSANIQVAAGAASTVTSNVSVSTNSLTANGTSTSTITVTLRDSESNQLPTGGQTIALSVTSGYGSIGTVADNANGTYTATYTSGTTVGTATISATLNTAAISETQSITLVHGPATKVTITQQPATGASGTNLTTQPKVVLRDANNNIATSDSVSTVTVAITSGLNGSLTGTKSVTVVSGEAVFTDLSFAGIVGTDYKLRFSTGSLTVADSNNLRVTPGAAVIGTSTITASSSSITANGASTSAITVQLKDAEGNALAAGGDTVAIRVSAGTGNVGSTVDAENGTYTTTFTSSTTTGTSTIRATLGGVDITATQDISLTPGPATKLGILAEPPNTTSSGTVLATQPRIAIQDAFGNTVTGDSGRSVVIGIVGNDGSLGGTTTRTSSSGIVSFTGISLAGLTSNAYRLSFTTSGLTEIDSQIITLTPGAASTATSTVTATTTSIVANGNTTSEITVTLRDAQSNLLVATGGTVLVSKVSGNGSISGTTDNGNGTYTATFTSPTVVGTTDIQATIGGSTITDTESITLVHGTATQIKITQTPITGANASTFTRQPKVTLFDANDNVVTSNSSGTVEVALHSGANGTLSGTAQATFANGVAAFTDISLTGRISTDYVLRFTSSSFTVDSGNLTLTPGTASASTSTIVVSDSTLIANGSTTTTVTVRLKDAQTNALVASGGTVLINVATGDGSISAVTNNNDGTYTATYTSGTVVGTKEITASINTATLNDTTSVLLVPGPAAKLRITQQPVGTSSGTALGTQPFVEITDAFNNRVTGDSSTQVTATISSGAGGTLGGTRTVTASLGVATFTDVTLAGLVSESYKLTFSSGSLTATESDAIFVTPGIAVASTSTISASITSITANEVTTSTITVQLKDAQGNLLVVGGNSVGMQITTGGGTLDSVVDNGNGTYSSTYTSSRVSGSIEIRARLSGVEIGEVQNLTLTPGAPTKLALQVAPTAQRSGEVLTTQPEISVQDEFGNVVTSDSGRVVTVAISAGNGGSLDGTLTASTSNGIASFTDVVLAGITTSNYVLEFTTPNLTSISSDVLTVSSGSVQVSTSTFGVSANAIVADGVTTSSITVTLRDAQLNALTVSSGTLEMFVTDGQEGFIGSVTDNGNGTYTATYTSGTLVSTTTITAKLNGVALTQNATVSLIAGSATQLSINTQPLGSASATTLSRQPVIHLLDAFGNHAIQDSSTSVTTAIESGSSGILGGSTTIQAVQGVVTFTDLTLAGLVSQDYVLRFSSGSLAAADSNNVTVTPGAASTSTSTVSSAETTLVAEDTNTTTVTITLKDAQGNLLITGGSTVGLAVYPVTSGLTDLGSVGSVTDQSDGTYTATYTAGTKVQSVRFSATLNGNAISDTSQLSLTHGAAYQIAVIAEPEGGASGSQLSTQPAILIQDRYGNTVTSDSGRTVSAALGGFQNSGTLSGTRTAVTSNGQATFAGIFMTGRINTQYLLAFTATGIVSANSENFTISQGPTNVTNSAIEADAAAIVANGTSTTEITVSIKDTEGNVVAASAGTVVLSVNPDQGSLSPVIDNDNGTYTSTFTAGTVSGTAQITGTLDGAALGGSASIILTSGPADNAQILVAPGVSASGDLLVSQPQIVIKDYYGNTVTSDSSTVVTVSLKSGESGTLSGTLTATADEGIAQFTDVVLSGLVSTNYVLEFDPNTSGVTSIDSSAITLTPGTPTQLLLSTPAATANSGQAFVTQPVLTAKDAQGNVATNFTADVIATISGASLQGETTIPLSSGIANFTDLGMFGTANSSYQVTYTTSSLSLSVSQSILLYPGEASYLEVVTQSTTEMNGRVFQTQPVIQIRDAQNNDVVTDSSVNVVATINTGSGTLSGTTSIATNSTGQATFTDLMVTGNTGSYTLTFAAVGLSIDSSSFALTPGEQTITRSTFGTDALPRGTYTPIASSYSGLAVAISIKSTSAAVCEIEDGEVTFLKMGSCVIKYNQSGNTHWLAADELEEELTVGRLTQTIDFTSIDDQPYGGTDVSLTATAESGLEVTFSLTSASSICVLNTATTVQIVGLGDCSVVATQSGDEVWAPASSVTRTFEIGTVVPARPTVASVSAGNMQATVSWNPPTHDGGSSILGYRVTSQPGNLTCETDNLIDSSCIVTGLTNGTDYKFVVQALNAIGYSADSDDSPEVTPATTADAVVGLTLTSTNKKLTANWVMPEQLGGGSFVRFEMFIRETGGSYGDAFTSSDANLTTFEFTKLDPNENGSSSDLVNGESYDVKIVIITDAIMAGDQSVTVLAGNSTEATQVPADVASAPTNVTILTTDGTQASVSWIASSSDGGAVITAYSVSASANNVAVTCVMQMQLDTGCEISPLTPGQVVNVSVRAINRIGSSSAETASMKLPTPPAPPTINTATAGRGFIQVVWAAPASDGGMALTGYVAKAMARGSKQVIAECTTIGTSCDLKVTGTEFDFDFAVWSMNRVGMSDSSNVLSPKRPSVSPTPTPTRAPSPMPTPTRGPVTNPGAIEVIWSSRNPMYLPSGDQVELQQGTTMAWRNGEFVEVDLVAAGTSVLQLSAAGGVVLQMQSLHPSGKPMDVSATGMLQVYQSRTVRIAGTGFAPNTYATVWIFSKETKLGEVMTDSNGSFVEAFSITADIPLGDHTIQINGEHPDGSVRTVAMGVNVQGEAFAPAEVTNEATGPSESESNQALGVIGAVALAFLGGIGVGILTLSQRRRKS